MNRKSRNRARRSCAAALVLVVGFAAPAFAADDKRPADAAVAQALVEARIEAARELAQKDMQNLAARLDAQDKRFDDQNAHIDHVLGSMDILLAVLGIVLTVAGVAGYFSIQNKAKQEAEKAASEWFDKNALELKKRLRKL